MAERTTTDKGLRDEIEIEYSHLKEGETEAQGLCPKCEGGSSRERTLSVSRRDSAILFNCFRASCGFSGRVAVAGAVHRDASTSRPSKGRTKLQTRTVVQLSQQSKDFLRERYSIDSSDIEAYQWAATEENRLYVPIRTGEGAEVGYQLRVLPDTAVQYNEPKALTYSEQPDVMAWYPRPGAVNLIVVEDIFSAVRASKYDNAVALLGTHMNEERAKCLADFVGGTGTIYLCLDADAFDKAVKLAIKYKTILPNLKIKKLKKDLKDLDEVALADFVEELYKL